MPHPQHLDMQQQPTQCSHAQRLVRRYIACWVLIISNKDQDQEGLPHLPLPRERTMLWRAMLLGLPHLPLPHERTMLWTASPSSLVPPPWTRIGGRYRCRCACLPVCLTLLRTMLHGVPPSLAGVWPRCRDRDPNLCEQDDT